MGVTVTNVGTLEYTGSGQISSDEVDVTLQPTSLPLPSFDFKTPHRICFTTGTSNQVQKVKKVTPSSDLTSMGITYRKTTTWGGAVVYPVITYDLWKIEVT